MFKRFCALFGLSLFLSGCLTGCTTTKLPIEVNAPMPGLLNSVNDTVYPEEQEQSVFSDVYASEYESQVLIPKLLGETPVEQEAPLLMENE